MLLPFSEDRLQLKQPLSLLRDKLSFKYTRFMQLNSLFLLTYKQLYMQLNLQNAGNGVFTMINISCNSFDFHNY